MRERGQAGVGIIIGIIFVVITTLAIIFVGWVWTRLYPSVTNSLTLAETAQQLGTDPSGTTIFFVALAFIGLIAGLFVWFILRPIGSDVRQGVVR